MALISRFEAIEGCQEARKLVKMIYVLTNTGDFSYDFCLRYKIHDDAVSAITII